MKKKYDKLGGISLRLINTLAIIVASLFSVLLLISIYLLANGYRSLNDYTLEYMNWEKNAEGLELASDYLSDNVRSFVIQEDKKFLDNYFNEKNVSKRRDNAINTLEHRFKGTETFESLSKAMEKSVALMQVEYHAMKLVILSNGSDINLYPVEIIEYKLPDNEISLSDEEKKDLAIDLVFNDYYVNERSLITESVEKAVESLDKLLKDNINKAKEDLKNIMVFQQVIILLLILFLISFFVILNISIVLPLKNGLNSIINDNLLKVEGIKEYKYFAQKYNDIRIKENVYNNMLEYEAEHDKLTGLYNRAGYDLICKDLDLNNIAYILTDIDYFKLVNDKYGHTVGDLVLKRVADTLIEEFNGNVYVSRIGGDEFSIIIKEYNYQMNEDIRYKVKRINTKLNKPKGNVPGVTLSFGVSISEDEDTINTIFKKADDALYETKKNGRMNVSFYKN